MNVRIAKHNPEDRLRLNLDSTLGRIYRRLESVRHLEPCRLDVPLVEIDPLPRGKPADEYEKLRVRVLESERAMSPESIRLRRRLMEVRLGRVLSVWQKRFPNGRLTKRRRYLIELYQLYLLYPMLALCEEYREQIAPHAPLALRRLAEYKQMATHSTIPTFFARLYPDVTLYRDQIVLSKV